MEEIPTQYVNGVEFHYVENIQDVWDFALTDEKVENAVNITYNEESEDK